MGKRRIEQKLGLELYVLGDAFNKHCPVKGPSLYKCLDRKELCDRLWHETDALCYNRDKDHSEEISRKAIDIALLALLLADRARRDAK